jgi:5-methylcytosine-specific restriction protein A
MNGPADHVNAAYPSWLARAKVPVTVLVGPRGNGARAYAEAHAAKSDAIIDLAQILRGLSGGVADTREWLIPALSARNEALRRLSIKSDCTAAWLVEQAPRAWQRQFWADRLGAKIILLDPGFAAAVVAARAEGIAERWVAQWYTDAADAGAPRGPAHGEARGGAVYDSKWQSAREGWLRNHPSCERCAEAGRHTPATVVDHKVRFRRADGTIDPALFWDKTNWQGLCSTCHNAAKGRVEARGHEIGTDASGRPRDPNHAWNRRSV